MGDISRNKCKESESEEKKEDLVRFSVSIGWDLLKEFDEVIEKEGFENRSLAVRYLIKRYILSCEKDNKDEKDSKYKEKILHLFIFVTDEPFKCGEHFFESFLMKDKVITLCIIEDEYKSTEDIIRELKLSYNNIHYSKILTLELDSEK